MKTVKVTHNNDPLQVHEAFHYTLKEDEHFDELDDFVDGEAFGGEGDDGIPFVRTPFGKILIESPMWFTKSNKGVIRGFTEEEFIELFEIIIPD